MKKELPEIFKKSVGSEHCNNKKVFYTSENKEVTSAQQTITSTAANIVNNNSSLSTVEEKIRKLFKSSRYIFNINVLIKTDKKDYDTKVAGKVKNSLVTVDNEVIPIVEINDIIIKDRL